MCFVFEKFPDKFRLFTIDNFQNQQIEVIIFDVVATNDDSAEIEQNDDFENDEKFDIKFEHLTSHVFNPNRINMRITRAKNCLIVVGQYLCAFMLCCLYVLCHSHLDHSTRTPRVYPLSFGTMKYLF